MFRWLKYMTFALPLLAWGGPDLTPEERAFVAEHPVIRARCTNDWPPLEFIEQGTPAGFIVEYITRIAASAGLQVDYGDEPALWGDIEEAFSKWELDILTGTVQTEQYGGYALFTDPYLYFHRVYVVRHNTPKVESPNGLAGLTVAATRGLPYVEVWRREYPEIRFLMVDTSEEMVLAVADGRADAAYTLKSTAEHFMTRHALINLRLDAEGGNNDGLENCFRFAVRSDWPELQSILNKAIQALPMADRNELWGKWFGRPAPKPSPRFSAAEQEYIRQHPVLRYSTLPDAPPIEFLNADGMPVGLTHDYMARVAAATGIRLEHVPAQSRAEKIDHLRTGRCDFLPAFAAYDAKPDEFLCTGTYMEYPLVVATRIDVPFINTLSDCAGRRVGLVARIGLLEEYQARFPQVDFSSCTTIHDGLTDLAQGNLYGVIGPQPVVAHQIQGLYLGNLKITGTLEDQLELCAAVRPEDAPLQTILNKVFASIPPGEQNRMLQKWFRVRMEQGHNYGLLWKTMAGAAGVLLLIALRYRSVARYNKKLQVLNTGLADSLEERDRIMSVISHDLRQPIQGYNQTLALLQAGEVDPNDTTGQRILSQSRQRGEQAIESMENLLDWLRKDTRAEAPHPSLLSPHRLAEDCRELLAASIEQKGLILENRIPPGLRIHADERRLSAVLRNLVNNAIKFSGQGGRILVEGVPLDSGVRLGVCDEGIGMPPETVQAIRAGGTIQSVRGTDGEKGSGMGLRLCRQLLAGMGSELEIASKPGQGSTFSFIFPAEPAQGSSPGG